MDPVLLVGLGLPIIFAILQILLYRLADNKKIRDGDRKYEIRYLDEGKQLYLSPVNLVSLRAALKKNDPVVDQIEVLPPPIWETSMGVDLSTLAISTTFINLFVLPSKSFSNPYFSKLFQNIITSAAVEFLVVIVIVQILKEFGSVEKKLWRIGAIYLANLLGLGILIIQFYNFGQLVTR